MKSKLKKSELKELPKICTKGMNFTLNGKVYQQTDGVCMESPLGPVLANVYLEETIAPELSCHHGEGTGTIHSF